MINFFLDKDDGEVNFSVDFYLPKWLRRLCWPDHSFDPEDTEAYPTMIDLILRDMVKNQFDDHFYIPTSTTYTMTRYNDFPNYAVSNDQD